MLQAKELRQAAEHAGGLLDVARKEHELAAEQLRVQVRKSEIEEKTMAETREKLRKKKLQPQLGFDPAYIAADDTARIKLTNSGHACSSFSLEIAQNPLINLMNSVEESKLEAHASVFFDVALLKRLGTTPAIARWVDTEGDHFEREFTVSVADTAIRFRG